MPQRLTTNIVPPVGPLDASMCFIGEAPGADEDQLCEPFVGQVGQFQNRVFAKKGILRSEVLLYNVFKQRPPGNRVGYYYQDKGRTKLTWEGEEHVASLRRWLEKLLERRRTTGRGPNVLVALGNEAMKHLTGEKKITKMRGSVLPCTLVPGFKVYVTYHPSHVQRLINEPVEALQGEKKKDAQNVLPLFEIDFDRIKIQSEFPEIRRMERTYETTLSFREIKDRLRSLANGDYPLVANDIETIQGEYGPVVWCNGFAPTPEWAFVIPILRRGTFCWSAAEEAEIWWWTSKIMLHPKVVKVYQNGPYDLSVLGRYYGLRLAQGTYEDTMFCHHACYPYLRKGLHVLTSMYTWEPYYKDEGRVSFGKRNDEAQYRYNGKDCCVTREIFPIVARDAKELGVWKGYRRTISILPSHTAMGIRGVSVDLDRKAELGKEFGALAKEAEKKVFTETGFELNLNSSTQKQRLLYGYLGLKIQFNPKTKKATVDKGALLKLKRLYPKEPTLQAILDYQKYEKLGSTYMAMKPDVDGRMHTSYGIVSTWRMNSRSSHFGGETKKEREGGNLQNIPRRGEVGKLVRSLFLPDEGKNMLASDRRQAEAMVVAWLAQDLERIEMFESGWDVHWFNAQRLFGLDKNMKYHPKEIWKDPATGKHYTLKELREIGKTVVHASNYGMGYIKLMAILAAGGFYLEAKESKALLEANAAANPQMLSWQRDIREEVRATRTLVSPIGRKRHFLGRFNANLYNAAYAFKPQNTVGEVTEVTIQRIWEALDYYDILLNVHDEVVGQCLPQDNARAATDIKQLSSYPIEIHRRILDIPVDFKVGPSWGELEEWKEVG